MHPPKYNARPLLLAAIICLLIPALSPAQETGGRTQGEAAGQADDVIRVKTELVQTDVTVLDKRGRFVEGLSPEQFELTVDGKPRAISFFERVAAGSAREAAQLAAMGRGAPAKPEDAARAYSPGASEHGRVIFFFLDDLHLSPASLARARKALADFVSNQMMAEDQAAVVSTSGQIGFLQQLTDNKVVLAAAIERLNNKHEKENNAGNTRINGYQANRIVEHNDQEIWSYLLSSIVNEFQLRAPKGGDSRGLLQVARNVLKNRARQVEAESKASSVNTLAVLESLMRSSAPLPGRKLVFFISDGFITDVTNSNALTLLRRVTDTAARVGVVVYTMDARGSFHDPAVDASSTVFVDGRNSTALETAATQEALNIIAEDTGGRAILNSNSFADAFKQGIDETSDYYLLAWRPEGEQHRDGKSKIKVAVKGRPDLRVRLRRNYYVPPPAAASPKGVDGQGAPAEGKKEDGTDAARALTPEAGLLTALGSLYPRRDIPTALSVGYVSTPDEGLVLKASMQIDRSAVDTDAEGKGKAVLDVIGAAVDDRGLIVTFKQVLTVAHDPNAAQDRQQPVVWNQQLKLKPGLYQVRVAVRERGSGRTGSAQQWIEVPDVSDGRFELSSLFFGERKIAPDEKFATAPRPVAVDVDHRFSRSSVLRFQTYVYNAAASGAAAPDVEIRARVLRGSRAVVTATPAKLPTDTTKDLSRLPYWSEIALDQLPPGRYVLEVTATDRTGRGSATQRVGFSVE